MAGKGRRPHGGAKPKFTWDVCRVENGEKFPAWIAGPYIRARVHKHTRIKVCLKEYVPSADCPGCRNGWEKTWLAYQPLYREPDKLELVGAFAEPQWDALDKMDTHAACQVGREWPTGKLKAFKAPLWINPRVTKDVYSPKDDVRSKPRCIAAWLPVLWGYVGQITAADLLAEEVTEELQKPVKQEPTVKKNGDTVTWELGDTRVPMPRGLTKDEQQAMWDEVMHKMIGHLKKPASNGKH